MNTDTSTPPAASASASLIPPPATPAVPPPAAPWSWADETGKFSEGWVDKLGDEFKNNGTLKTIPDMKTFAKVLLDTKSMVGKRQAPPTDASTPEDVNAWKSLIGAPLTPEDYGELRPQDLPAELWDAEIEKEARALAHKHHVSLAALKDFAALNIRGTQAAYQREQQAAKQALEQGQMQLRAEWGEHYERNRARALAVGAALGIPENDEIFASRPDLLSKLAQAAPSVLGGDKIVNGAPLGIGGGIDERIRITRDSPEYQGMRGGPAQEQAQRRLHQLMEARENAQRAA